MTPTATPARAELAQHDPAFRAELATELLHAARAGTQRADRAMAHCIRAALRYGLEWRDIATATGLNHGEATECMDRWPGDG